MSFAPLRFKIIYTVLLTLTANQAWAQEQKPQPALSPDSSQLLVQGPLKATLVDEDAAFGTKQETPIELHYLTESTIYYHRVNTSTVKQEPAQVNRIVNVQITDATGAITTKSYSCDKESKKYVGDGKVIPSIDLTPLATDTKSEEFILYYISEWIYAEAEKALQDGDTATFEMLAQRAADMAKHASGKDFNPAFVSALEAEKRYISDQAIEYQTFRELIDKITKGHQELYKIRKEINERKQTMKSEAVLDYLLTTKLFGKYARPSATRQLSDDVFMADLIHDLDLGLLEKTQTKFGQEATELLKKSNDRISQRRADQQRVIRTLGHHYLDLPMDSPLDEFQKSQTDSRSSASDTSTLKVMEARLKRDQGDNSHMNPFAMLEYDQARAAVVLYDRIQPTVKADRLEMLAKETLRALQLVPKNRVYDFVRFEILKQSAELSLMAIQVAEIKLHWSRAYHPTAAYAVQSLQAIQAPIEQIDLDGEGRELLALARLLAGFADHNPTPVMIGESLAKLRNNSARYHVSMSYLLASTLKSDRSNIIEVLNDVTPHIEQAFALGFTGVQEIRENPCIRALRLYGSERQQTAKRLAFEQFRTLISPDTKLDYMIVPTETGCRFEFTNKTKYTMTNLQITGAFYVRDPRTGRVKELLVPSDSYTKLEPGKVAKWDIPEAEGVLLKQSLLKSKIKVVSDQDELGTK